MSSLYFQDDLEPADAVPGATVTLSGSEARHALTVNRTRVGERLSIGDGRGLILTGPVVRVHDGILTLAVESAEETPESTPRVSLVQALAKGDRDELAIQAATELGVDRVIPWSAERSVSRWTGPRSARGEERWRAIVREASKQSIRARVPEVGALASLADVIALTENARGLVLEPSADADLTRVLRGPGAVEAPALVLIVGPEGGVSPSELARFAEAGVTPVRIGRNVLRTSTAGPAALATLNVLLARW